MYNKVRTIYPSSLVAQATRTEQMTGEVSAWLLRYRCGDRQCMGLNEDMTCVGLGLDVADERISEAATRFIATKLDVPSIKHLLCSCRWASPNLSFSYLWKIIEYPHSFIANIKWFIYNLFVNHILYAFVSLSCSTFIMLHQKMWLTWKDWNWWVSFHLEIM